MLDRDSRDRSVLIVDDSPDNLRLLAAVVRRCGLVPRPVTNGPAALAAAVVDAPDLVLLDIGMPGMSGLEVCRLLKQDARLQGIPVIFISGHLEDEEKVEAFRVGGVDYVTKPIHEQEVAARVLTHLRLRRLQADLLAHARGLEERVAQQVKAVTASQGATIFALAKLAAARDDDTGRHVERVQTYARRLAEELLALGLHRETLTATYREDLFQTASLHDIGKVGTPDAILLKPGRLTTAEFEQMKQHCILGATTLDSVLQRYPESQFLRMGVEVARSHHERWDGGGYPDGLSGADIPLSARIVAVADFYDAMVSSRCYRPPFSHQETCALVREGSGRHFDPGVALAFGGLSAEFQRLRHELRERPTGPLGEEAPATREAPGVRA